VLSRVDPARSAVQTVIIVPTRELALQVSAVLKQLASSSPEKILIMSLMEGSQNRRQQLWAVAEPPHIVVGNPKAIQRLITAGRLRLSAVNTVVVDEVDACLLSDETRQELHILLSRYLSNSFKQPEDQEAVESTGAGGVHSGSASKFVENSVFNDQALQFRKDAFVLSSAGGSSYRNNRQTILCSATVPQRQYFAMQCYKNGWTETLPEVLHVSASELMPAQVQHETIECEVRAKLSCIKYLLRTEAAAWAADALHVEQQPFQAIIFADSDESTKEICATLSSDPSFSESFACMLTETMGLDSRAKALDAVRSCQSKVLVCTEILARGIDVPSITHVLQFTLPSKSENYLHRFA
jgi:superfamily II DNA/RNA helicase